MIQINLQKITQQCVYALLYQPYPACFTLGGWELG